jgi:glycine/D-amino acid oxidase-like deaminating enzyme
VLPRRADVVVVGGGVIGSSILYHLSKKKIQAVLLEKGELISGTSGACDGLIFLQSKKPGPHLRLAQEGIKRFSNLKHELHFDVEYKDSGGMIIIENDHELEFMERFVAEQRKTGLDIALLDSNQAREKEPALSEKILGSTFSPSDGKANPLLLTHAFVRSAKKLGARAFTETELTGIALKSHQVRSVKTGKGEIETTIIVNAAGVHAPEIGKLVHLDIPIKPRRGQLLVTEPKPPVLNSGVLSAKYIAAKFDPGLAGTEGEGISIDQTSSGNLLLGSTREFVGFDTRTTYQAMTNIAIQALHIIPQLKDTHIIRTFAGLRPYTPDGLPILGNVDGLEGFIVAAGHEGDGVALSPITGELIAELIDTKTTRICLNEFRLERFHC